MTCPAVLVETAFLSNINERQLLISDKWQAEIAERLFKAFEEYKSIYDGSVTSSSFPAVPASVPQTVTTDVTDVPSEAHEEYFGIQIMGLGRLLKGGDPSLKGLVVNPVKASDSNIYKYIYGTYPTIDKAKSELVQVRKKFPEAFIVKVKGNKVSRAK